MPTVDIAGIATHYEISGSGPPISDYWNVPLESQPPDLIRDRILAFFAASVSAAHG